MDDDTLEEWVDMDEADMLLPGGTPERSRHRASPAWASSFATRWLLDNYSARDRSTLGGRSRRQRVPPASTVARHTNHVGQGDAHAEAAALQKHVLASA